MPNTVDVVEGPPIVENDDEASQPRAKNPNLDIDAQTAAGEGFPSSGTQEQVAPYARAARVKEALRIGGGLLPAPLQPFATLAANAKPTPPSDAGNRMPADPADIPGTPEYIQQRLTANTEGWPTSPPPKPKPIVGGGTGPASSVAGQIGQDYNEQLEAAYAEKRARQGLGQVEAEGADKVAGIQRDTATGMASRVADQHRTGQYYLNEIYKLTHAYADGNVDPDKFWHDKSPVQKIATILGAALLSAGSALTGGGASAGVNAINGMVDRSIAIQQANLDRKRVAAGHAENLYGLFLHQSKSEMEAYEKTRAVLLDAAMTDITKARAAVKGKIQDAEADKFIAALRIQRDEILARLHASASGGGGGGVGAPAGWLEVDPKSFVTGADGQQYLINNPNMSDDVTNALSAFARVRTALQQGQSLLDSRRLLDPTNAVNSYNNLKQGEVIDAAIAEAEAKLASSRGLPPSILATIKQMKPSFGSTLGALDAAKIPALKNLLNQWEQDILRTNNARPFDMATGPGMGKHVGELKTYGRPTVRRSNAAPQENQPDPYARFQPTGQ